ncbi:MAG: tRNA (adenosine(37)-N6)-dimethylallyltransferase MiaA [Kineosporiaceae bacterium]
MPETPAGAVPDERPPVVAVVGPTASGKSDLAVSLALELSGEAVNADAMQLYRGMDIGTAKVPVSQRRGVVHHLLDVLDVVEEASVAAYQRDATAVIDALRARGATPVLVGGSGLYVRAALDLMEIPPTDAGVRRRWEQRLAEVGAPALHAELARRDPAAAAAILPGNGRRIVRALEVGELTGAGFPATLPEPVHRVPTVVLGLSVDRERLDERIAARVDAMWEAGLVAEVQRLLEEGLAEGRTASRALGYQQVVDALAGRIDMAQARELTVSGTRRYARRQLSWLRRDSRVTWLPSGADDLLERALEAVSAARVGTPRAPVGGSGTALRSQVPTLEP